MTTQSNKPQAIFPNVPRESPAVDKQGNFTALWSLAFGALFQALQQNFKNEGIVFPPLTASSIATILAIYSSLIGSPLPANIPDISGQTVFDTTNRISKQFIITYDGSTPPLISSAQWMMLSLLTVYAGNPNGNVGGALNWFCYDSVNGELFICTTAGSANGTPSPQAVWTGVVAGGAFLLL